MTNLDRPTLLRFLGYPGGFPTDPLSLRETGAETAPGLRIRQLRLVSGRRSIPATLLLPDTGPPTDGLPGILYCHAHGNRYDIGRAEVLDGRPALLAPPLGTALARAGYAVMCADMPGFGTRRDEDTEAALAKAALWQGRSLLGDMIAEQMVAWRALTGLAEVDGHRTAALGISMGATLAYATAALVPQIACAAHLCAFADMAPLIAAGAHDLHGVYMVIPGLLRAHDMGDIAALVAPRPQLVCAGLRDPLTPEAALAPALARLKAAYAGAPRGALRVVTDAAAGHEETPAFRAELMAFLSETLGGS